MAEEDPRPYSVRFADRSKKLADDYNVTTSENPDNFGFVDPAFPQESCSLCIGRKSHGFVAEAGTVSSPAYQGGE